MFRSVAVKISLIRCLKYLPIRALYFRIEGTVDDSWVLTIKDIQRMLECLCPVGVLVDHGQKDFLLVEAVQIADQSP